MRRIEALCRRGVAEARHHRRTVLRCFSTTMSLLHNVSALYLYAITMPGYYDGLVARHSDVAIFHRCNVTQLQLCDGVAFRRLSDVIL
jgi:hypothetical protein